MVTNVSVWSVKIAANPFQYNFHIILFNPETICLLNHLPLPFRFEIRIVTTMSHIEKEEDSVEGDTSEETQPNETSLHRDLVRQLLEDRDLNLVTKYSLWKEVKAEYDDE